MRGFRKNQGKEIRTRIVERKRERENCISMCKKIVLGQI